MKPIICNNPTKGTCKGCCHMIINIPRNAVTAAEVKRVCEVNHHVITEDTPRCRAWSDDETRQHNMKNF